MCQSVFCLMPPRSFSVKICNRHVDVVIFGKTFQLGNRLNLYTYAARRHCVDWLIWFNRHFSNAHHDVKYVGRIFLILFEQKYLMDNSLKNRLPHKIGGGGGDLF